MSDFWKDMQGAFSGDSSLDLHLQGKNLRGKIATNIRDLTDQGRSAAGLSLPQEAGNRVRFESNIGSLLTYDNPPQPDAEGTVILVKTAMGKTTSHDDRVFVLWDDGEFRAIQAQHLRSASKSTRRASNFRMRVSDIGDLAGFFSASSHNADELVHKSTKDLWSVRQDDGGFVIERLFNDDGHPLKT